MDIIFDFTILKDTVSPFINPQKRIFIGYIVASAIVAILLVGLKFGFSRGSYKELKKQVWQTEIWWGKSSRLDYKILVINRLFMLLLAPVLLTKIAVATWFFIQFHEWFDGRLEPVAFLPDWSVSLLFTFVLFILDDSSKYLLHRLMHTTSFLWYFHKIHHDAENLTPFTVYRIHPVEGLLFNMRAVIIQGGTVAAFAYFFGTQVNLIDVWGANIFIFLFNVLGSNLRHSHIWIGYPIWLEHIFISPAQHQIHHSKDIKHYDMNFGVVLAVWDWIGKSLYLSSDVPNHDGYSPYLKFGTEEENILAPQSITNAYLSPFIKVWNHFK